MGLNKKEVEKLSSESFKRGYFCAVAVLLREEGCVSAEVRNLFDQGGDPKYADTIDQDLFKEHGLIL